MQRRVVPTLIGSLALATALAPAAWGQTSEEELRQEVEALKKGQQQILEQLEAIQKQLQARPAAPAAPAGPNVRDRVFDLGANPVKGEQTAKLTMVEFTDYQ